MLFLSRQQHCGLLQEGAPFNDKHARWYLETSLHSRMQLLH